MNEDQGPQQQGGPGGGLPGFAGFEFGQERGQERKGRRQRQRGGNHSQQERGCEGRRRAGRLGRGGDGVGDEGLKRGADFFAVFPCEVLGVGFSGEGVGEFQNLVVLVGVVMSDAEPRGAQMGDARRNNQGAGEHLVELYRRRGFF